MPEPELTAVGARYDRARMAALPEASGALAGLIASFANTAGGYVILGAELDPVSGAMQALPGVEAEAARGAALAALAAVDPPLEHLISMQALRAPEADVPLLLVSVRQSPSPPHLIVPEGAVLISGQDGVRSVRSRAELDALYERGRAERERAERLIDAMIERLLQSHYAVYGVGFVACTQSPTAEPYLWARDNPQSLVEAGGRFSEEWKLSADLLKVRPGEVELRGEGETAGYVRVTRSGCVAVGEVRRRLAGNVIGSMDEVAGRVAEMAQLGCTLLAVSEGATVVPRLFFEGMRNQRVVLGEKPHSESAASEADAAQIPGTVGLSGDPEYRTRLVASLSAQLLHFFKVDLENRRGYGPRGL